MAEFIAGYAPTITISGSSVLWARGEYDIEIFAGFTTSNYVANVTEAESSQITSNDGVQTDGSYKITVTSTSGWAAGNRCVPQTGSTVAQYSTLAAAYAALPNFNSTIRLCYSSTTKNKSHDALNGGSPGATACSLIGMMPMITITALYNAHGFWVSGDFSSQNVQMLIKNILFLGAGYTGSAVAYDDTSGTGAGVKIDRCRCIGQHIAIHLGSTTSDPSKCTVRNSEFINGTYGVLLPNNAAGGATVYNCTFTGLLTGVYCYSRAHVLKNNIVFECTGDCYATSTSCTGSNNSSDDSTAPGTDLAVSRADCLWLCDLGVNMPVSFRPTTGSDLLGAGTQISGVTYDIDGNAWPNPPAIGCSNGPVFLESIPAANKILSGSSATDVYGTTTSGSASITTKSAASPTATAGAITANHALAADILLTKQVQVDGVVIDGEATGGGGIAPGTVIEGTVTVIQAFQMLVGFLGGKTTLDVAGTTKTVKIRDTLDTKDRITATVINQERTDVTLNLD